MVGAISAGGPFWVLLLVSWPVVVLFVACTAFAVLLLLYLYKEERYRRPPRPEKGVEFVAAWQAVEVRIAALAPEVMLLAEKERLVAERLEKGALSDVARRKVEGLLREAASGGFWERFAGALVLADLDPVRAYGEFRRLSPLVETALKTLTRAEKIVSKDASYGRQVW